MSANSSDRVYGFGIVGCGVIAPTHADAISRLDNAELVAVSLRRGMQYYRCHCRGADRPYS